MTALYSIWHLLVDGMCALAMFGKFIPKEDGYFSILLYNFCAFALQMPFGVILDRLNTKDEKHRYDFDFIIAVIGVICTVVGVYTNPVILGIGNALFHIGGGVGTIHDSPRKYCSDGRADNICKYSKDKRIVRKRLIVRLGIFVAPGAVGLYLGTLLANMEIRNGKILWVSTGMLLCVLISWLLMRRGRQNTDEEHDITGSVTDEEYAVTGPGTDVENAAADLTASTDSVAAGTGYGIAAVCLVVVILRSYIGMAVGFSWKTGILEGLLAVLALACGKTAGGFLASRYGAYRTAVVSLILAAMCYLFSFVMPIGLVALFLFNMTMPITLYWVVYAFPRLPGFAFGILTFALFLGFLPKYMGLETAIDGTFIGCAGSILSLLLISAGLWKRRAQ